MPTTSLFLKVWYTYHYRYARNCLLVRGLSNKSKYKEGYDTEF